MSFPVTRLSLVAAVSMALAGSLSACGGGGNVRPTPSPQPADTCSNGTCSPPQGSSSDEKAKYPAYNQLIPTRVTDAHKQGYTGKDVKVALMDSGIDLSLSPLKHLDVQFRSFLPEGDGTASVGDTDGHGSVMAQTLAGAETDDFVGGVAPDVDLYVGQICSDSGCGIGAADAGTFYDQGVRLFNYSMGDTSGDPSDPAFKRFIGGFGKVVDGGSLLVWAGGNDGPDKLSSYAVAPSIVPELEKGWLAVVNVHVDDSGKVTGLDKDSARCGVAAEWCLAAPGYVKHVPVPGSDFTSGYADGTSSSTAVVTGVAALVWQAFPWMSGHNVQQTLLTTAKHMGGGDSGEPDATYGWGLVDAGRAVQGPGRFVGEFDADVGTATATFANAIDGNGSLVLDGSGAGRLELSADNRYGGGTLIHGASLYLSGSVASGVTLDGGALAGFGTVHGKVDNAAGRVSSEGGDSGHGLTITGDYEVGGAAVTSITFGHPLSVGGKASLDGTLQLMPADSDYHPQSTETLIQAGSVQGVFAGTDTSHLALYTAKVEYADSDVTASLSRTPVTQAVQQSDPVVAHASHGVEKALRQADGWSRSDYAGHAAFLDNAARFLSATTESRAVASVRSLSGEIHGTSAAIEASASAHVDDAVASHQHTMPGDGQTAVWVQVLADDGGLAQDGYASARYRGHGELFGLDVPLTDRLSGGIVAGHNRLDAHLDALAGRMRERDLIAGVHGRFDFDRGVYLAGRVTWMHADVDVQRTALMGDSLQGLRGAHADGIGRFTLEAGRDLGGITPYLALTGLRLQQGAFAEKGAAGFGLRAPSQHHDATLSEIGARFTHHFTWAGGRSTLTGHAGWRHVVSGARMDFRAAFTGAPQALFVATGQSLARNVGRAGIRLDTRVDHSWDWYLGLDAQGDRGRYHAFAANAGARYRF